MSTFFYIPGHHLPSTDRQQSWLRGEIPSLLAGGKSASAQAWIFQTWAELRGRCDVELATSLPAAGAILTLANFLDPRFRPIPDQFLVTVVADFLPHPGAHVQIVQNAAHARRLPGASFLPHWPQPNLIPRHPGRGTRFESLGFFGDPDNLCPELRDPAFQEMLARETGARIEIRGAERWHDYSDVDAVVAIRDFSRARHIGKPATKLYNAWLAGVPCIGGSDSAFSAEAVPGRDYLRVTSPSEFVSAVKLLKSDPALREALTASGHKKTASRSRDAVRDLWSDWISKTLPQEREKWRRSGSWKTAGIRTFRRVAFACDRIFRS